MAQSSFLKCKMTDGNKLACFKVSTSSISNTLLDWPPTNGQITLYSLSAVNSGYLNGKYNLSAFKRAEHGHSTICLSPFGSRSCIRAFGSNN